MRLGVLITHFHKSENSQWLLYNCLDSIQRHEPELMKSVVVCDDASPMTDIELARMLSPYGVAWMRRPKNISYSKNVNMGLKFLRAKGVEYALVLNNDITLTQPVTSAMKYFEEISSLAILGIRLWFPDGRLQHGGIELNAAKEIHHPSYGEWDSGRPTRFVHAVTGAFQFLHLAKIGLYPEEYPLSYEDVALCMRTWRQGGSVLYTDSVSAIHSQMATRGSALGPKEYDSLIAFHRENFLFPEVERQLQLAQEHFPHERLQTLLSPQPPLQYERAFEKKEKTSGRPIRKAKWAQARRHLKLAPVGPAPKE